MAQQNDPYRSYNFKLEIGGVTVGHFTERSEFSVEVVSIPNGEAGNLQLVPHTPSRVEYAAVTLKYGVTKSSELWDWMMNAVEGVVQRRNVSVLLLDSQGDSEVMRWNLIDAWPSEWQGAALNDIDKNIAIASLTLVFDRLEQA